MNKTCILLKTIAARVIPIWRITTFNKTNIYNLKFPQIIQEASASDLLYGKQHLKCLASKTSRNLSINKRLKLKNICNKLVAGSWSKLLYSYILTYYHKHMKCIVLRLYDVQLYYYLGLFFKLKDQASKYFPLTNYTKWG